MFSLLKFFLFNVLLPTIDVATDLFTFLTLFPDHPRWASIVLTWMFTSFFVHAGIFVLKRATGKGRKKIPHTGILLVISTKRLESICPLLLPLTTFGRRRRYSTSSNTEQRSSRWEITNGLKRFWQTRGCAAMQVLSCLHGPYAISCRENIMNLFLESMYEGGPQAVTQVNTVFFIVILPTLITKTCGRCQYFWVRVSWDTARFSLSAHLSCRCPGEPPGIQVTYRPFRCLHSQVLPYSEAEGQVTPGSQGVNYAFPNLAPDASCHSGQSDH